MKKRIVALLLVLTLVVTGTQAVFAGGLVAGEPVAEAVEMNEAAVVEEQVIETEEINEAAEEAAIETEVPATGEAVETSDDEVAEETEAADEIETAKDANEIAAGATVKTETASDEAATDETATTATGETAEDTDGAAIASGEADALAGAATVKTVKKVVKVVKKVVSAAQTTEKVVNAVQENLEKNASSNTFTLPAGDYYINEYTFSPEDDPEKPVWNATIKYGIIIEGDVTLIIKDGMTITIRSLSEDEEECNDAGILVCNGASLTIEAGCDYVEELPEEEQPEPDGSGKLIVYGGGHSAAIGGTNNRTQIEGSKNGSNITINGANVYATGGYGAAGIGGSAGGTGSNITINGGYVEAKGGGGGAGIGSGMDAGNGSHNEAYYSSTIDSTDGGYNITINGGTVRATGGDNGAGIGGGYNSCGHNITINGGDVRATGKEGGAGIGGGANNFWGSQPDGYNILITGGTVVAKADKRGATRYAENGAGIGGGRGGKGYGIKITGGNISAYSGETMQSGEGGGAGIGGSYNEHGSHIEISGGTIVAEGYKGAAIGGGQKKDGYNIIITGGVINAETEYSDSTGAGIGGGESGKGFNIRITGGKIYAYSYNGAGIGCGQGQKTNSNKGYIYITPGEGEALNLEAKSETAYAIGSGKSGKEGDNILRYSSDYVTVYDENLNVIPCDSGDRSLSTGWTRSYLHMVTEKPDYKLFVTEQTEFPTVGYESSTTYMPSSETYDLKSAGYTLVWFKDSTGLSLGEAPAYTNVVKNEDGSFSINTRPDKSKSDYGITPAGTYYFRVKSTINGNPIVSDVVTYTIKQQNVNLVVSSATKMYNGTPLTSANVDQEEVVVAYAEGDDGFTIRDTVIESFSGFSSITDIGQIENNFTSYTVKSRYTESNYNFNVVPGTLTVTDSEFIIEAEDFIVPYDGQWHYFDRTVVSVRDKSGNDIKDKVSLSFKSSVDGKTWGTITSDRVSMKNAGKLYVRVVGKLKSDTTKVVEQTYVMEVTKRSIILSSESMEMEYNGPDYELKVDITGTFAKGEGIESYATTLHLKAGTFENVFSYTLKEGTNPDNYDITKKYGTIKVSKSKNKVEAGNSHYTDTWAGEPIKAAFSVFGLVGGDKIETSADDLYFDSCGKKEFGIKINRVVNKYGEDVTSSYSDVRGYGSFMIIYQCEITLTSADGQGDYNEGPLKKEIVTINGNKSACEKNGLTFDNFAEITEPGEIENTFSYHFAQYENNYKVTVKYGTLKLVDTSKVNIRVSAQKEIPIEGSNSEIKYDYTSKGVDFTEKFEVLWYSDAEGTTPIETPGAITVSWDEDTITIISDATHYRTFVECGDYYFRVKSVDSEESPVLSNVVKYTVDPAVINVLTTQEEIPTVGYNFAVSYDISTNFDEATFSNLYGLHWYSDPEGTIRTDAPDNVSRYSGGTILWNTYESGRITINVRQASFYAPEQKIIPAGDYYFRIYNYAGNIKCVESEVIKLTIGKQKVHVSSKSASKEYDGTELKCEEATQEEVYIVKGKYDSSNHKDTIIESFSNFNSITELGTVQNTFDYKIKEEYDNGNFEIVVDYGTLAVHKCEITVANAEAVYDGTTFTNPANAPGADKIQYSLKNADGTWADWSENIPSLTEPGELTIKAQATWGSVTKETGEYTLTVLKRKITIASESATAAYSGSELTCSEYSMEGDDLLPGDEISLNWTGKQLVAGSSYNTFECEFNDPSRAKYYDVTRSYGTLTVERSTDPITITTGSATQSYNGNKLSCADFSYVGTLLGEDELQVITDGVAIEVGTVSNTIGSYKVMNGDVDVTESYTFAEANLGTLRVTPRSIVVKTSSAEKVYDGKALTSSKYTITGEGFIGSDGINVNVTGTITNVGSAVNEASFTFNEGTEAGHYSVVLEKGTLKVIKSKSPVVITAGSASKMYDGTVLTCDEFTSTGVPEGFTALATVFGEITDAGTTANVIETYKITDAAGANVTDNFTVYVVDGTLEIAKRKVTFTSGSAVFRYQADCYRTVGDSMLTISGDGFASYESGGKTVTEGAEFSNFTRVRDVTTDVEPGYVNNEFTYTLISGATEDNYEITTECGKLVVYNPQKPGELSISPKGYEGIYDGEEHKGTFPEFEGATLTREYATSTDDKNYGEFTSKEPGLTNVGTLYVRVRAEIAYAGGSTASAEGEYVIKILPRNITLTSDSAAREYDGTALKAEHISVSGDGFLEGDEPAYTFTGKNPVDVGSEENTFSYEFKTVEISNNYAVTPEYGTLEVTKKSGQIKVTADSATKIYDGKKLGFEAGEGGQDKGYEFTQGILASGDELIVTMEGSLTDVGVAENKVASAKIMRGDKDVTSNYNDIVTENGMLEVTKRQVIIYSLGFAGENGVPETVTIKSGPYTGTYSTKPRVYNGKAQSQKVIVEVGKGQVEGIAEIQDMGFADGEGFTAEGFTEVTDVGYYTNTFDYELNEGTKASNYDITVYYAPMRITKAQAYLSSASSSKVFDGKMLKCDTVNQVGFAEGEGADVTVTGYQIKPGTSDNTFTYTLKEGTKASNYDISTGYGTLVVYRSDELHVEVPSVTSFTYNGEEQGEEAQAYIGDKLLEDADIWYCVDDDSSVGTWTNQTPKLKNVGTLHVKVSVRVDGYEDAETSYTIIIEKKKVKLTSDSASKEYDGTALTAKNVKAEGFAKDEGADYTFSGSQLKLGESRNTFTYVMKEGTLESNYDITTEEGTLTVYESDKLYVEAPSDTTFVYNGKEQGEEARAYAGEQLIEDAEIQYCVDGENWTEKVSTLKNAGTVKVKVRASAYGYKDAETTYTIIVDKKKVTLTSDSASRKYDGTALTAKNVKAEGFAEGEGARYTFAGSQTEVGKSENKFTYELNEGTLESNYDIEVVYGTLEVLKADNPAKTGDGNNAGLWATLAAMALLVLAGVAAVRKKQNS